MKCAFTEYSETKVLVKRPYLGRYLQVVTLADERTIHNAFPDRRFKP